MHLLLALTSGGESTRSQRTEKARERRAYLLRIAQATGALLPPSSTGVKRTPLSRGVRPASIIIGLRAKLPAPSYASFTSSLGRRRPPACTSAPRARQIRDDLQLKHGLQAHFSMT
ncbi:hypothetical protein PVAP13_2KG347780 [Panicum virgatum]|uniref:Uncharacterized protein n=1 Tax=Panicum virgatum TaxID=38727 RepID=A0A8T0W902_PANVG|nr:hypothetical protein PVAP13_2KG347780 [Panicum virgatum]